MTDCPPTPVRDMASSSSTEATDGTEWSSKPVSSTKCGTGTAAGIVLGGTVVPGNVVAVVGAVVPGAAVDGVAPPSVVDGGAAPRSSLQAPTATHTVSANATARRRR